MNCKKHRVLLIEDNPGDARLIRELLVEARESPFGLDHAGRLSTGLHRLAQGGIDVILLDLSLPDSQGLDSLGKLYAQAPKVPVVVLSGLDDETLAVEAVHEGAQDYLVKGSVDSNLLVRSLRYAIERHRLRQALRESEARYRLLADNAADVIWTRDIDLRTTYVSPSVTQMSGYSVEEVMSLSLEESLTPASLEIIRTALSKVRAPEGKGQSDLSEAVVLELELIRKDGSTVPVEMKVNLLRDSNGRLNGFLGVTRDITERKKAEEALRESVERLRRLVNNAPDILFRWSVEKGLEYVSPVVSEITGYSPEELMANPRLGFELAKLRDPQLPADYEKATSEGIYTRVRELPFVRKDGRQAYLDIRAQALRNSEGKVVAIEGILRDITERKKAEEALRESEEHYSALVSSLTDAVFKIKGGLIVWCNDKVEAIYGYTKEELVGKKVSRLFPEGVDYREFVGAVSAAIKKHRSYHDMGRVKRKDGSLVDVEYTLSQIPGRDPIELVTVARDITERKRAEAALRESEERFRRLVNHAPDIIFRWSVYKGLEYISPAISTISGYSPEELLANPMLGFELAKATDSQVAADYERVVAQGISMHVRELPFLRKDGTRAYLDIRAQALRNNEGKVIAFEGIMRDITERKKMEEALRQSEHNYRVLFESTIDGLIVIEAAAMKIILANQAAARMYGFNSVDDGIGVNPLDFVHPDDRDRAHMAIQDIFENGFHQISEFRTFAIDGRELRISAVGTRTEYQERPAGLISFRDITEQKRAEEERQRLEEQLRLAGRLAAVGELAAGVAHELNNPLTAIQGFAQFLTSKNDLDATIKKDLETIYRESQRATKITKNLLYFARQHEPEKRLISINEALAKTLDLRAHQMKVNNIELLVELQPDLPLTMADFYQMQQVFVNIVNNAEQAMIEAHGRGKLLVQTKETGDMIQISFTDDGPGISEENLKRIFDPFFTTKEVGKGTGLGLSICYGLVEAHGGHIFARSKPGKGATFSVEIPIISNGNQARGV